MMISELLIYVFFPREFAINIYGDSFRFNFRFYEPSYQTRLITTNLILKIMFCMFYFMFLLLVLW